MTKQTHLLTNRSQLISSMTMTSSTICNISMKLITFFILVNQYIIITHGMFSSFVRFRAINRILCSLPTIMTCQSFRNESCLHPSFLYVHPYWYAAVSYILMIFKTVEWHAYECVHVSQNHNEGWRRYIGSRARGAQCEGKWNRYLTDWK